MHEGCGVKDEGSWLWPAREISQKRRRWSRVLKTKWLERGERCTPKRGQHREGVADTPRPARLVTAWEGKLGYEGGSAEV